MRGILNPLLTLLLASAAFGGSTKSIRLHGYVTDIRSQTSFDIDDYRVNRDSTVELEFEKDEESGSKIATPEDIRVGTEVEIRGEYDADTHVLAAKAIKVFPSEMKAVKRTAILETPPILQKRGSTWGGSFRADGQILLVDETTKLSIIPNKTQSKAEKAAAKAAKKAAQKGEEAEPLPAAVARPEDVHPNMYVSYEGVRDKAGAIRLSKAEFKDNERTSGETRLWKSVTPKVTPFKASKPGELRIANVGKFKTVPNEEVQQYVQDLARKLVPANQRDLTDGDENKIPFRTYVVEQKSLTHLRWRMEPWLFIHRFSRPSRMRRSWRLFWGMRLHMLPRNTRSANWNFTIRSDWLYRSPQPPQRRTGRTALATFRTSSPLPLQMAISEAWRTQADRLGVEYMVAAGYDPREAPRAWKAMSLKYGDSATNLFWSSHDNNATRRSYLMAELRNNYADTNFSSRKRDSEEFHKVVQTLAPLQGSKAKMRVKY